MNKKKWFVLTLAALLLLSVFAFAIVALAEDGETPPPFISGDLEPDNAKKKKATATPGRGLWTAKPIAKPTPEPTEFPFNPGLREDHEGHSVIKKVTSGDETKHTVRTYCEDCKMYFGGETVEPHTYNALGTCSVCYYICTHGSAHTETYPTEDSVISWNGSEYNYDAWQLSVCDFCGIELSREQILIRVPHGSHENFSDPRIFYYTFYEHQVFRTCLDCRTVVSELQPHAACPDPDLPFVYDFSYATHARRYTCPDCGGVAEERRPHVWAHDSYKLDGNTDTHIEVLVCTVCGYKKEVRAPHRPIHLGWENVSNKQHREIVRCNICETTYTLAPAAHKMADAMYTYSSNGPQTHTVYTRRCSICRAPDPGSAKVTKHEVRQGCSLSCAFCGEVLTKHDHSPGRFIGNKPLNAEQHVPYYHCRAHLSDPACFWEVPGEPQPHTFDPVTMKCTACGYLKEGCEHSYTYKPAGFGTTAEQHTLIGTCTNCGKQITVTGAHDMQFYSATEYAWNDNSQHTYTLTLRCSSCGYETTRKETEKHTVDSAEPISAQEHKLFCSKCSSYSIQQHNFVCTPDKSAHECSVCGEKGEHDYLFIKYKDFYDNSYHISIYQCKGCSHQKEEREDHHLKASYTYHDPRMHLKYVHCTLCKFSIFMRDDHLEDHVFDENGVCVCGYHEGNAIPETSLSEEALPENTGNEFAALPAFAHLTADGKEIPCGYMLLPVEDGETFNLVLLPEAVPGNTALELRFTASEIETLRALGVESVYIRLNDIDVLLLGYINEASGETVFTLTPHPDGMYAAEADPA